jgi:hypothetical protein
MGLLEGIGIRRFVAGLHKINPGNFVSLAKDKSKDIHYFLFQIYAKIVLSIILNN